MPSISPHANSAPGATTAVRSALLLAGWRARLAALVLLVALGGTVLSTVGRPRWGLRTGPFRPGAECGAGGPGPCPARYRLRALYALAEPPLPQQLAAAAGRPLFAANVPEMPFTLHGSCRAPDRGKVDPWHATRAWGAEDRPKGHGRGAAVLEALTRHPWYRDDDAGASAVFTCLGDRGPPTPESLLALPPRNASSPYVVWMHGVRLDRRPRGARWKGGRLSPRFQAWAEVFANRTDILYSGFDLADHRLCDNAGGALPGVALPPPFGRDGAPPAPTRPMAKREIDLAFAGKCHAGWFKSNRVRPWLAAAVQRWRLGAGRGRAGVVVDFAGVSEAEYDRILANARVGLALPGDGRWSYRLSELMQHAIVPFVLADGLALPFAPLVDWTQVALRRLEATARDFDAVLGAVEAKTGVELAAMQRNVGAVWAECWATPDRVADCLVRSLSLQAAAGSAAEAGRVAVSILRGPDCPSRRNDPRRADGVEESVWDCMRRFVDPEWRGPGGGVAQGAEEV